MNNWNINIFKSPFIGLLLFLNGVLFGQEMALVKGVVLEAKTNEPLPYVAVSIQNKYTGTVTNPEGFFQIHIDQESNDTLVIDMLGYKKQLYPVDQLRDSTVYRLEEEDFTTDEVVISPLSPEEYIKRAVNSIKENNHPWAYNTQTYFKEEVKINDQFLGESEAIFKSYAYSIKRHKYQLMLHRGTYDSTLDNGLFFTKEDPRDFAMGPEFILRYTNDKGIDFFLDSNLFNKYEYSFAPDTLPGYTVIAFEPKGKVDRMKMGGQVILESGSNAIVEVRYSGVLKIPIVAKPLLTLVGFGYRTPYFNAVKKYQKIGDKWFPSYTHLSGGMTLINRNLFKKNDVYVYEMDQLLHVNKIIKKPVKNIPKSKRYDYRKPYKGQVHNDDQLKWSDINRVK